MRYKKKLKNSTLFKSKILLIFAISFFSLTILLTTISLAFFSKQENIYGTITLGELDFCLTSKNINSLVVMPKDEIEVNLKIINSRNIEKNNISNLIPFFVRARINCQIDDSLFDGIEPLINSEWQLINNYYYYLGVVNVSDEITFCNSFYVNDEINNLFENKEIDLSLTVETIQATRDALISLWPEASNNILNFTEL